MRLDCHGLLRRTNLHNKADVDILVCIDTYATLCLSLEVSCRRINFIIAGLKNRKLIVSHRVGLERLRCRCVQVCHDHLRRLR